MYGDFMASLTKSSPTVARSLRLAFGSTFVNSLISKPSCLPPTIQKRMDRQRESTRVMIVPEELDVEFLIIRDISSPTIVQNAFTVFALCEGYTSISALSGP